MLVCSPSAVSPRIRPSRLWLSVPSPSGPPSESANEDAAAPNASSGMSTAARPAVSNERVASARVASPSQRGDGG